MELLQLKYFCDAAKTQNFSETARKYLVPTSNISQSIKRLENELGCVLFEHRSNKILLNDEGKAFYANVKQALSLLEVAREAVSDNSTELQGEIKVVCRCNRRLVTEGIEKFIRDYPQVKFSIHYDLDEKNDFDILISDICPCEYDQKILLVEEDICIAAKKDHPLFLQESLSLESLKNERFISMSQSSILQSIMRKACEEEGFIPNIAIQTDDPFYIRKYVALGLGIAFVPSYSWKGLFSSDVKLRPIEGLRRKTYAFLPKSKHTKKAVKLFLDILKEIFL